MLNILYEDDHLLVCRKPSGIAVQNASVSRKDMESMARTHLMEKYGKANPYLAVVHRIDQPVEGLVVFAKTPKAASSLSAQVQDGRMKKEYLAAVCGSLSPKSGTLVHFLKKEPSNRSRAVPEKTPGAKKAVLDYEVLEEAEGLSLVRIRLKTGRHHQIRVQMAASGVPLYADAKYNPEPGPGGNIALCASALEFVHPADGKKMNFAAAPENPVFHRFSALASS